MYLYMSIIIFTSAVPEERYFIVATRTTIARVSLDGQRFQTVVSNLTNAVAIDYDYRYKKFLRNKKAMYRANIIPTPL